MTGLLVLGTAAIVLIGYLWLIRTILRFVNRRTGSRLIAALAVVALLLLTFGDTLVNRLYHREVLCHRDDVGVKILEKVELPAVYLEEKTQTPKLPYPLGEHLFFSRFSVVDTRTTDGVFPLTAHSRVERKIVDNESGKVLAKYVDYWPSGGPWWAFPILFFDESSLFGWLWSRQQAPSCLSPQQQNALLGVASYFYLIHPGKLK